MYDDYEKLNASVFFGVFTSSNRRTKILFVEICKKIHFELPIIP